MAHRFSIEAATLKDRIFIYTGGSHRVRAGGFPGACAQGGSVRVAVPCGWRFRAGGGSVRVASILSGPAPATIRRGSPTHPGHSIRTPPPAGPPTHGSASKVARRGHLCPMDIGQPPDPLATLRCGPGGWAAQSRGCACNLGRRPRGARNEGRATAGARSSLAGAKRATSFSQSQSAASGSEDASSSAARSPLSSSPERFPLSLSAPFGLPSHPADQNPDLSRFLAGIEDGCPVPPPSIRHRRRPPQVEAGVALRKVRAMATGRGPWNGPCFGWPACLTVICPG